MTISLSVGTDKILCTLWWISGLDINYCPPDDNLPIYLTQNLTFVDVKINNFSGNYHKIDSLLEWKDPNKETYCYKTLSFHQTGFISGDNKIIYGTVVMSCTRVKNVLENNF